MLAKSHPGIFRRIPGSRGRGPRSASFLALVLLGALLPRATGAAPAKGVLSGEPLGKVFGELFSPPAVSFERFDAENLLPQSSVYDLLERRDGYLWLVTLDGLVRFDGVRQRVYDRTSHPSLATTRLTALWDDPATGGLWIGAEDGRLALLRDGGIETFAAVDPALGAVTGLQLLRSRLPLARKRARSGSWSSATRESRSWRKARTASSSGAGRSSRGRVTTPAARR